MNRTHLVVIGDAMLDRTVDGTSDRLCPDAPVPVLDVQGMLETAGGAGLAALMCAESGCRVTLVAPIATDPAGRQLTALLAERVSVLACGHDGPTRTKTRIRSGGQPLVRLDEGGPGIPTTVPAALEAALDTADAILVSDYGAGLTHDTRLRSAITAAAGRAPVVWDPHPRGAPPTPGTTLATPNLSEARGALAGRTGDAAARTAPPEVIADLLAGRWPVRAVSVTAGAAGAFLAVAGEDVRYLPAVAVPGGDPCGAGDRFAASAAVALAHRELLSEAVARVSPTRRTGWPVPVAGAPTPRRHRPVDRPPGPWTRRADTTSRASPANCGPGAGPWSPPAVASTSCTRGTSRPCRPPAASATRSWCWSTPTRRCAGSRDRIGPWSPRTTAPGSCRPSTAWTPSWCSTTKIPVACLAALRPDVWVKGGDYGGTTLPEGDLVASYGGSTVLLPYLSGRSTTTIIERTRASNPTADLEPHR